MAISALVHWAVRHTLNVLVPGSIELHLGEFYKVKLTIHHIWQNFRVGKLS